MRGAPQPQSRELSDAKAQLEQDSGNERKEGRTGETGLKMVEEERERSSPEDGGGNFDYRTRRSQPEGRRVPGYKLVSPHLRLNHA